MSPEEGYLPNLVRRALHENIWVKIEKRVFGVRRVDRNSSGNVAIYNNKYLDPLLGLPLKKTVQTPLS